MVHKSRMSVAQRRQLRMENRKKEGCAMRGYESFHMLPAGSSTIEQVRMSSGGINGYADYVHERNIGCEQLSSC